MKVFLILFLFASLTAGAQDQKSTKNEKTSSIVSSDFEESDTVYNTAGVDIRPEFPGGMNEFYAFIRKNYKAEFVPKGIRGKVFVTFVIEKDGSVGEIVVNRDFGYGTGAEAERVLKLSPKWTPGMFGGENVRVKYSVPIVVN